MKKKLKKYDYLILHISYSSHRLVNYPECEFFVSYRDQYMENVYDLATYVKVHGKDLKKIYSHEEYIQYVTYLRYHEKRKKMLVLKKLVLNLSENKEEIFRIMTPMNNLAGYYVTEKLKKKIEAEGFTGMAFKPLEELNPHVEIEIR